MDVNNRTLPQLQSGHVIMLREPYLHHASGTRAICFEAEGLPSDLSRSVVLCVLEGGEVHAFSLDALVRLKAECIGYLPAFRNSEWGSCMYYELLSYASSGQLFDQLLEMRRSALAQNVRRGAEYLDAKDPTWWKRLVLSELDLSHECLCVIGQLRSGDFACELQALLTLPFAPSLADVGAILRASEAYGFVLPEDANETEYETLTDLWRAEVLARRSRPARQE
jgi:hypothetical protein